MNCAKALVLALVIAVAFLLAGCGGGGEEGQQVPLVTVNGLVADSGTHVPLADAIVAAAAAPAVITGADGLFSAPDLQPGTNLAFNVSRADYNTLAGSLSLDATARTWSLSVSGVVQAQGALIEDSPGHLSIPETGQAGTMVVDLTPVGGGGGGEEPPPPPFQP